MQEIIPFSVVERTDDGESQRRRFIAWTRVDNMSLKEYEPYVPLSHPAYYLHNVSSSFAVKRDLACSFFQIGLPLESRAKFRFSHEGEMYEMTVMPMGHRCAPEIMHTVTATIEVIPTIASNHMALLRQPLMYILMAFGSQALSMLYNITRTLSIKGQKA